MSAQSPHQNLHWSQHPFRELVRLAWPITVSMLSFSAMSLVDGLIVGHLGTASLAGVGLGTIVTFILICFPLGLLRGAKTLASQAVGAGRREELARYRGAALVFALGAGALAILVAQCLAPFIGHLSEDPTSGAAAMAYMRLRVLGAPAVLTYRALRETLYAEGDTRSPMVATLAANVVNAALASFFVYGLHLGVTGAAIATALAHTFEASVLVIVQLRRDALARRPTSRHLAELWRLGVPSGIQFVLEVGSFTLLTLMLQGLSHIQGAAHQIALQVNHVAFLPAFAISEAASVLVGQAIGANRDDLVRFLSRRALLLATAYTGTCAAVMAVFARFIVGRFTSSSDVEAAALVDAAAPLLWIQAVFIVFDAANVIARGVLGGAGDVRYAAYVGIATAWAMTPPLTWLLGLHFGLGAAGGWLGLCGEIVLSGTILIVRVERGGWRDAARQSRERLAETHQKPAESGPALPTPSAA